VLRPHLGDTVLEVGAGLGNLTARLMARKLDYVAAEKDPLYLHALRNRFLRTPNVRVCPLDPENPADYTALNERFDCALCVNVLDSVGRPEAVLSSLAACLKPGGALIVLVAQGPGLFGSLDRTMGIQRRFTPREIQLILERSGFQVERLYQLNKFGALSWFLYGKILGRKGIPKPALKLFDKTVWFWRRIDGLLPWRGLSLIAIARRGKENLAPPDGHTASEQLADRVH
jgi:SAM-dependent methyltransferase